VTHRLRLFHNTGEGRVSPALWETTVNQSEKKARQT
jgi:hypothetical protein